MKHKIKWTAETQEGNILNGTVKAKTYKKALAIAETILEHHYKLKVMAEIKLECID